MAKECGKCGATIPDDSAFCLKCGARVAAEESEVTFCRFCGKPLALSSSYTCPHCGSVLAEQERNSSSVDLSKDTAAIVAAVSVLIAVVASFMPFFTYSVFGTTGTVSLWSENFIFLTLLGLVLLGAEVVEVLKKVETVGRDSIVLGVVFMLDIILQYMINKNRLSSVETGFGPMDLSGMLNLGVGFYLLILSSIGLIVAGVMYKQQGRR
ncbi:MAG: zinc ribbon domain-containing protein [Lachnospiraceae bacterium]|nr:zinc ribbon domain-containing protein [Lachnospiraceae bacterium]